MVVRIAPGHRENPTNVEGWEAVAVRRISVPEKKKTGTRTAPEKVGLPPGKTWKAMGRVLEDPGVPASAALHVVFS